MPESRPDADPLVEERTDREPRGAAQAGARWAGAPLELVSRLVNKRSLGAGDRAEDSLGGFRPDEWLC